jgi:hypothetical protein
LRDIAARDAAPAAAQDKQIRDIIKKVDAGIVLSPAENQADAKI